MPWEQGLIVQSILTLTSSIMTNSLNCVAMVFSNPLIFFAAKMWVAFAMQWLFDAKKTMIVWCKENYMTVWCKENYDCLMQRKLWLFDAQKTKNVWCKQNYECLLQRKLWMFAANKKMTVWCKQSYDYSTNCIDIHTGRFPHEFDKLLVSTLVLGKLPICTFLEQS